jgi:hypothetical protein
MSLFDDREKSHERKFQLDQELAFKAKARRNKLLGVWAAERLGLAGVAAETYARDVAAVAFGKHGDAEMVAKVAADLAAAGAGVDETRVRAELERCAAEARRQLGATS